MSITHLDIYWGCFQLFKLLLKFCQQHACVESTLWMSVFFFSLGLMIGVELLGHSLGFHWTLCGTASFLPTNVGVRGCNLATEPWGSYPAPVIAISGGRIYSSFPSCMEMLGVFLCIYWPFTYLLFKMPILDFCTHFLLLCLLLLLSSKNSLYILKTCLLFKCIYCKTSLPSLAQLFTF